MEQNTIFRKRCSLRSQTSEPIPNMLGHPVEENRQKKRKERQSSGNCLSAQVFLFAPLKKTSVSCSDVSILCCLVFSFLVMVVSMKLLFLAPSCLLRQNRRRKKFLSKLWCLTKKGHSCCCHPQIQFTYLTSFSLYSIWQSYFLVPWILAFFIFSFYSCLVTLFDRKLHVSK